MGKSLNLDPAGWKTLTIRYAIFFVVMAALNELIWRTQSESFWVSFKVFGLLGLTIGFSLLQMPFLGRHMQDETENEPET